MSTIPKDPVKFGKLEQDPLAKLENPAAVSTLKPIPKFTKMPADMGGAKPPLKLSTKGPIKIIPRDLGSAIIKSGTESG